MPCVVYRVRLLVVQRGIALDNEKEIEGIDSVKYEIKNKETKGTDIKEVVKCEIEDKKLTKQSGDPE